MESLECAGRQCECQVCSSWLELMHSAAAGTQWLETVWPFLMAFSEGWAGPERGVSGRKGESSSSASASRCLSPQKALCTVHTAASAKPLLRLPLRFVLTSSALSGARDPRPSDRHPHVFVRSLGCDLCLEWTEPLAPQKSCLLGRKVEGDFTGI